ncbi:MAG: preprotein translocase subunit YajC [Atribacterota bacterium]|nr:preprotein translocase subunit YajC [Candidatus Atribacteria bacterium]
MNFFHSIAYAATGGGTPAAGATAAQPSLIPGGALGQFLPLIFIIIIFYFLLIRPQQQRQKSQKDLLSNLKKGDSVVTAGGVYGTITQVGEDEVTLEVAKNVMVRFSKSSVSARK